MNWIKPTITFSAKLYHCSDMKSVKRIMATAALKLNYCCLLILLLIIVACLYTVSPAVMYSLLNTYTVI